LRVTIAAEIGVTGKVFESMIFTSPPRVTLVGFIALALKSKRFGMVPVPFAASVCSACR
jgi:hypothetical protein